MARNVVLLNKEGKISVTYTYDIPGVDETIRKDVNGQVVTQPPNGGVKFEKAKSWEDYYFYSDGSLKTYENQRADGSGLLLNFASKTESGIDNTVQVGDGTFHHGKVNSYTFKSPDVMPANITPYQIITEYANGHIAKIQLLATGGADNSASFTATYDEATNRSTMALKTANLKNPLTISNTGNIDAARYLDGSAIMKNDGTGIELLGGGGFKLISPGGAGLVASGAGNWSVISNDGGTLKPHLLISNDGGGLKLSDLPSLISPGGAGLVASGAGNVYFGPGALLISNDGGGLVSHDGGGLISNDGGGLIGNDGGGLIALNGAGLLGLTLLQNAGNSGASLINNQGALLNPATPALPAIDFKVRAMKGDASLKETREEAPAAIVDLTVTGAGLDRSSANIGDTTLITWTVDNIGQGVSDPSQTKIFLSKDQTLSSDDRQIGLHNTSAVEAQAGNAFGYLMYTVPNTVTPGQYYVFVTANADGKIAENGANNTSAPLPLLIKSASTSPDLTVSNVSLNKNTAAAGDTVQVSWTIKEAAMVAAGASNTKVYISSDRNITASDILLRTPDGVSSLPQAALGPGNSTGDVLTYKLNDTLAPGTWYVGVIADADGQVAESNESNNASAPVAIQITPRQGADLSVQNFDVNKTTVAQGGDLNVTYDLANTGTTTAGASRTQIYLSTDATITTADTLLTYEDQAGLASGAMSHKASLYAALPRGIASGTYYIGALADGKGTVAETSETNNASNVVAITVSGGMPNFKFYENKLTLDATTIAAGGSGRAIYAQSNIGTATASASKTGLYLSTDATITTGDQLVASFDIRSLTTSGPESYHGAGNAFTMLPNIAPGTYYLGLIADHDSKVPESNETDNVTAPVQITVTQAAPPTKPTVTLNPVSYDNLVNRAEVANGIFISGTTTGIENGRSVTIDFKTTTGLTLGSTTAQVQNDLYSLKLPAVALPANLTQASLLVTADVSNAAGVAADEASRTVIYDGKPPALRVGDQTVTVTSKGFAVKLSGLIETGPGAHVVVLDDNYPLAIVQPDAKGVWKASGTLAPSTNSVTVLGFDGAGNAADGGLILKTMGPNKVQTGSGNDTLTGSTRADTLYGGNGKDELYGGGGKDTLYGQDGNDTFVFKKVADSRLILSDTIGDFNKFNDHDRIDLSEIDLPKNFNFRFIGDDDFTKLDSKKPLKYVELHTDVSGRNTKVVADINQNGRTDASDLVITVNGNVANGHSTIDKGDFIL